MSTRLSGVCLNTKSVFHPHHKQIRIVGKFVNRRRCPAMSPGVHRNALGPPSHTSDKAYTTTVQMLGVRKDCQKSQGQNAAARDPHRCIQGPFPSGSHSHTLPHHGHGTQLGASKRGLEVSRDHACILQQSSPAPKLASSTPGGS